MSRVIWSLAHEDRRYGPVPLMNPGQNATEDGRIANVLAAVGAYDEHTLQWSLGARRSQDAMNQACHSPFSPRPYALDEHAGHLARLSFARDGRVRFAAWQRLFLHDERRLVVLGQRPA